MSYTQEGVSKQIPWILDSIERSTGSRPKDIAKVIEAALETRHNLVNHVHKNKKRGEMFLVVRDSGNSRYQCQTHLNERVPFLDDAERRDAAELTEIALETLAGLLEYIESNKNRGNIVLVVRNEKNTRFRCHTSLNVIIPFRKLK